VGRREIFFLSQECKSLRGAKHEARRVAGLRIKDDEIFVGIVGRTIADGIIEERQASASDRGRWRPLKAGPITEQAGFECMT